MKAIILPVIGLAMLTAGCSSLTTNSSDVMACTAALVAAGVADPASIPATALMTPACTRLAADVLNGIISQSATTAIAQRRKMGMH